MASIQLGCRWKPVFETLAEHGVAVTGGRDSDVGAGGFILGGGNSFSSASPEWACDNVVTFEVVLADGRILNANADDDAELWIALKGGSGSFGVVTRLDMKTIEYANPKNHIYGGSLTYDPKPTKEVIAAFTRGYKNDVRVIQYAANTFDDIARRIEAAVPSEKLIFAAASFQPLVQPMVSPSVVNGGNMLGLESWIEVGNGVLPNATVTLLGAFARSENLSWDWRYLNYADGDQDPIASYGQESVDKVRAAAEKYDTQAVFQKLRKYGFKIPT
ncbi:FAD binding domain-containing protein [Xylariaceae sp. FL1651]|nr:FAD binding domain-containing protein [Xylariaceae sp. FL1651]